MFGKFEATKVETPAPVQTPAPKFQPRQQRDQNQKYNNPRNNNYNNPRQANNNNNTTAEGEASASIPQQPERKQVEKPYEFEGILTGTGYWKSCPTDTASSVHPITTIFPHPMIFTFHNRK